MDSDTEYVEQRAEHEPTILSLRYVIMSKKIPENVDPDITTVNQISVAPYPCPSGPPIKVPKKKIPETKSSDQNLQRVPQSNENINNVEHTNRGPKIMKKDPKTQTCKSNSTEVAIANTQEMETQTESRLAVLKKLESRLHEQNEKIKSLEAQVQKAMQRMTLRREAKANKLNASDMIPIGEGNAKIPIKVYRSVNFNNYTSATRKLLTAVFPRNILATHTVSGKRRPGSVVNKKMLDAAIVNDIIQTVVERCDVSEDAVRATIIRKCADASKVLQMIQYNKKREQKVSEERVPSNSQSE